MDNFVKTNPTTAPGMSGFGRSATRFLVGQIAPFVNGENQIVHFDGQGDRRSWGVPYVWSTPSLLTPTCAKVAVRYGHKYGGVSQDYFFCLEDGKWVRRMVSHKNVRAALAEHENARLIAKGDSK